MAFNFSSASSNIEGINKFLTAKGITLSSEEQTQLESIFTTADKSAHKENENGYNDGKLDFFEQSFFNKKIEEMLPAIKDKIKEFFIGINEVNLKKTTGIPVAQADATKVVKNHPPELEYSSVAPQALKTPITAKYSVTAKKDTVYDKEIMNQALNNLLKNQNSKLKDKAIAFLDSSQKDTLANKLDPFILIAISMHESANGNSKAAQQKNNIGGIMGKGGLRKFDNVESCIDSIANTVNKRVDEGKRTIGSIGYSGRYCAKSAAPNWIRQVVTMSEKLRKEYNRLLAQKYGTDKTKQ